MVAALVGCAALAMGLTVAVTGPRQRRRRAGAHEPDRRDHDHRLHEPPASPHARRHRPLRKRVRDPWRARARGRVLGGCRPGTLDRPASTAPAGWYALLPTARCYSTRPCRERRFPSPPLKPRPRQRTRSAPGAPFSERAALTGTWTRGSATPRRCRPCVARSRPTAAATSAAGHTPRSCSRARSRVARRPSNRRCSSGRTRGSSAQSDVSRSSPPPAVPERHDRRGTPPVARAHPRSDDHRRRARWRCTPMPYPATAGCSSRSKPPA